MTNYEKAQKKLIDKYKAKKRKEITEEEFNEKYYKIIDWAIKNNVPCSQEKRMDGKVKDGGRSPWVYFSDIERTAKRENHSFEEYFIGAFKRKGWDLEWGRVDKEELGMPKLKAADKPDHYICVKEGIKLIDTKNMYGTNILHIKLNNLCSYEKYKSGIFMTTFDWCFYLTPSYVKYLFDNFKHQARLFRRADGKEYVCGKKPGIEISNREGAHVSIADFKKDKRTEDWGKNEDDPQWTRAFSKYNKGRVKAC